MVLQRPAYVGSFRARKHERSGSDVNYRHLYDSDLVTRPLFCFGRAPVAPYFTIGANPSADDFREERWGPGDLGSQAFSYFERVVPHCFFANWGAALDPLGPGMSYRSGRVAHPKRAVRLRG